jgi:Undecaprenyl-phosphate galactose phosphotransferase WbaP
LLFGSPQAAASVVRTLEARPSSGLRPAGLVAVGGQKIALEECFDVPDGGYGARQISLATARELIRKQAISYGIVATPDPSLRAALVDAATALSLPRVLLMNPEQVLPSLWCDARDFAGLHATEVCNRLLLPFPRWVKRAMDATLSVLGGILILPLLVALALVVKLTSRGPIFFGQTRIGQNGQKFTAWKFRTMRTDAAEALQHYLDAHPELLEEWNCDHKLKNDPRVTTIGHILRSTSLDELPQLWNVIRGDMSLVGPRPIVEDEIEKYGEIYRQYLLVPPGITGIWQVSGRNNISYQERIELDRYYVQNWSPWLDFHLLMRTVWIVFNRHGAY